MATTYPYNKNIPLSTNKPSVDQPNMQTNTNSISSIISTDHLTFGTATGNQIDGMHTVVRLAVPQGSDPVAIGTIGQIYTKTLTIGGNSDQCLFFESGGGRIVQLTSFVSVATGNQTVAGNFGYTPVTGGIIFQWGYITLPGSSNPTGTVTFATNNIAFPTNCFNVSLTLNANSNTSQANTAFVIGTPSKTSFNWGFTGSTSYNYIYWTAIGN